MKIYHIGTIALESKESRRELKSIGGISGYTIELMNYAKSQNNEISFVGKIYNYHKNSGINYFQVQDKLSSTNRFLINLFLKSINIKLPKNAVIHAHRPDHLAAFILLNKRPSVVTLHGQQALTVNIRKGYLVRKIYKILEKFALRKVDKIIAVDPFTQKFYTNLYPKHKHKITTIPTGVNIDLFFPKDKFQSKKALGYDVDKKIILYVGRIEPPKKVDTIIKAFLEIIKKDKSYRLVFVGDGVTRQEMENLSVKFNLSSYIYFLGVRRRNELPDLFNAADVSVLISGNEGSPLSVKESLACGVPVVANDVGDIASVVKNNFNGFIVNSENLTEIAEKVIKSANSNNEFKQNCLDSVAPYTIPAVSEKVLNLYEEIAIEK